MKFDYSVITATANRNGVKQATADIRGLMSRSAQDIVDIGRNLLFVKGELDHGQFGEWLKVEFAWDERTARRFMAVAERFKTDTVSDLDFAPTALYALSAPDVPEEATEEAIEAAEAGETITPAKARTIINNHKPKGAAQTTGPKEKPVKTSKELFVILRASINVVIRDIDTLADTLNQRAKADELIEAMRVVLGKYNAWKGANRQ